MFDSFMDNGFITTFLGKKNSIDTSLFNTGLRFAKMLVFIVLL